MSFLLLIDFIYLLFCTLTTIFSASISKVTERAFHYSSMSRVTIPKELLRLHDESKKIASLCRKPLVGEQGSEAFLDIRTLGIC